MIHSLLNHPENRKENISPHFQLWEVDCQSGKLVPDTYLNNAITLAKDLEIIRSEFNLPIIVSSWFRTVEYNNKIDGSSGSYHLTGRAVDLIIENLSSIEIFKSISILIDLKKIRDGGLGLYDFHVHYDHGPPKRRWDLRKNKT